MSSMRTIWHYEQIVGRAGGNGEWRVGDSDDNFVEDFATQIEAALCVSSHNALIFEGYEKKGWKLK